MVKDVSLLLKMVSNGYNLSEPEHSKSFCLQQIEILMPQIFEQPSVIKSHDLAISEVFYKEKTPLIDELQQAVDVKFKSIEEEVDEQRLHDLDATFISASSWFDDAQTNFNEGKQL